MSGEILDSRPIFFFDLEPVLDCAGPTMLRNPIRLQMVCEHCVKSVTGADDTVFEGTGFYLIVTSCDEPQATQIAKQISSALLKCFFGTAEAPRQALRTLFRRPNQQELSRVAVQFTGRANVESREAMPPGAAQRTAPVESDQVGSGPDSPADLCASGAHGLDSFRFGFVPMHDLRKVAPPSFFCEVMRPCDTQIACHRERFASIRPHELPRIDEAMLLRTLAFSKHLGEGGIVAAVGTSVSFETLAWSKGRQLFQNALRASGGSENPLLIVMIDMVPPGTPSARLQELVSILRPFARRVFVQLPENGLGLLEEANLGAGGYAISVRAGVTREETAALAMRLAKLCRLYGALSFVQRIPDFATADLVQAAGIRFGEGNIYGSQNFTEDTQLEEIRAYELQLKNARALSAIPSVKSAARGR